MAVEFFLFTTHIALARRAEQAGVDSIIVDWETRGKEARQKGFNLETNRNGPKDVRCLSACLRIPVTVRINPYGAETQREVDAALDCGARIIMLPMAKQVAEVWDFLALVRGRAKTVVQVETPELADQVRELNKLPWDYAYIGLNDLMVARGGRSIWEAVLDGTAEKICAGLAGRRYGFGGSTILGGGEPVLNVLILHELVRLGGSLSVMRRTLKSELLDRDLAAEVAALRTFLSASARRGEWAREHDHDYLCRIIRRTVRQKELPYGGFTAADVFKPRALAGARGAS